MTIQVMTIQVTTIQVNDKPATDEPSIDPELANSPFSCELLIGLWTLETCQAVGMKKREWLEK